MTASRPFTFLIQLILVSSLIAGITVSGCGSAGETSSSAATTLGSTNNTAAPSEARAVFLAGSGTPGAAVHEVVLNLEVALTATEKSQGLMDRREMAPDHGMVFVWEYPVSASFWMKNTDLPLSIAFVSGDGVVVDLQEMAPLSLDTHAPDTTYTRAVEANRGFFTDNGIRVGDAVRFEGF